MIETGRQGRTQRPPVHAQSNGSHGSNGAGDMPLEETKPRRSLRAWTIPAVIITLLPVLAFGVAFVIDQASYVSTDNAQVSGTLAQLGPLNGGQVRLMNVEVGDEVARNQVVATVFTANGLVQPVRATFDGIVVARYAAAGDAVTAGKPVLAVLNPDELWVEARVDEMQAVRIRSGQPAEVTLDALGQTLRGYVLSVGSASVGAVSAPSASQNFASGRPRQLVPVRIGLDGDHPDLVYGGLALVKIHVR